MSEDRGHWVYGGGWLGRRKPSELDIVLVTPDDVYYPAFGHEILDAQREGVKIAIRDGRGYVPISWFGPYWDKRDGTIDVFTTLLNRSAETARTKWKPLTKRWNLPYVFASRFHFEDRQHKSVVVSEG